MMMVLLWVWVVFADAKPAVIKPAAPPRAKQLRAAGKITVSATAPRTWTEPEQRALYRAALGGATPPDEPQVVRVAVAAPLADEGDDRLVLFNPLLVWSQVGGAVFAGPTSWPRVIVFPKKPGKTILVDCHTTGGKSFDVVVSELIPPTRDHTRDEPRLVRASAYQIVEPTEGHVLITYVSSPAIGADDDMRAFIDVAERTGAQWLLFRCAIARLD
jgi:hypothetical protein